MPGEGDEFMAVKPWKGAIKEPVPCPKANPEKPKEEYEIDWVYGYRSDEGRMNLFLNNKGEAVYPTAALGVVYNFTDKKQKYFGGGPTEYGSKKGKTEKVHTDDVTALCMNAKRTKVATGQNGQKPQIFIWDSLNAEYISILRMPKGSRQVSAIGFSSGDAYLAACDMSEKISVHIFSLGEKGGQNPISDVQINQKVLHLAWNPNDASQFATVGKDHMMLCSFEADKGNKTSKKAGAMKSSVSHSSIAWSKSPSNKSFFTGGADGKIYHWTGAAVTKTYDNCKGAVHSLCSVLVDKDKGQEENIFAGGNDKKINVYSFDGKSLTKLRAMDLEAAPRSIDVYNGQMIAGLKNGNIMVSPVSANDFKVVMRSHCDGEIWGLEVIHLEGGEVRVLTSADDGRILAYDLSKRGCLAEGAVNVEGKEKKKKKKAIKGGASSMSSQPPEAQSRCLAYLDSKKHLAVANNVGRVTIRDIDWAQVDSGDSTGLNNVINVLFDKIKKPEWIEFMSYSPDEKYLGVGSHDNFIYLMDVAKNYK